MADETVSIELLIDASKSATSIEDLEKSTKELNDALQKTEKGTEAFNKLEKATNEANQRLKETVKATGTAEQKFESLKQEIDSGGISIRDMNKKIQEFQTIAIEAGRNSPIGKRALQEAANLRDRMVDIQNETKRLSNDHLRMQGVLEGVQVGVAGFGAMQSITALAGEENEELAKTLTKITATQTLLNSVMAIKVAFEKESNLMTLISIARTEGLSKALGLQAIATNGAALAQKGLNLIMSLNPIGIITMAIAGLVAGIIALQKPIQNAIAKFESMNGVAKVLIGIIAGPLLAAIYAGTKALEYFGIISTEEERAAARAQEAARKAAKAAIDAEREKTDAIIKAEKEKRDAREKSYDFEIAKLQAAGQATFDVEQEKLRYVLESLAKQKEALQKQIEFEKKIEEEKLELVSRTYDIRVLQDALDAKLRKINKQKELKETIEQEEEAQQTITINEIKENKKRADAYKKLQEEKAKALEEERKRIDAENAELLNDLMGDFERDEKARQAKLEAEKKLANDLAALAIEVTAKEKEEQEKRLEAQRAFMEAEKEAQQNLNDAKIEMAQGLIGTLSGLAGENKKLANALFIIDKALAIGNIVVQTQREIAGYYANPAWSLMPDGGVTIKTAYATAAKIRAATSIASIVGSSIGKFMSGGGGGAAASSGGGGGVGLRGPNSPGQANMLPATGETVLRGNQMDTKVVVVESDITNVQSRVNVIENQAKVR